MCSIRLLEKGKRLIGGPLLRGRKQVLGQFSLPFSLVVEFRCHVSARCCHRNRPEVSGQHVYYCLICCHYDSGIRNLPDQLSAEATIETLRALLHPHGVQGLPERAIFATLFPQPSPRDL